MPKSTQKPAAKSDGRRSSKKPPKQTKIMDAIAELKKADDIAIAALEKDPDAEDTTDGCKAPRYYLSGAKSSHRHRRRRRRRRPICRGLRRLTFFSSPSVRARLRVLALGEDRFVREFQ
jgi:hypothetical protein